MRARFKYIGAALAAGFLLAGGSPAFAAEDDSVIARNLYTKPLTHRETPPGYRNKPIQYTPEPNGFRDNPRNWSTQPIGYREKPIPQLDEPRNGNENPFNFVARDSITVANLDESLKTPRDQVRNYNLDADLKIPTTTFEETSLADNVHPRNPGYKGINPPSKARLQSFQ